MDGLPIFTKKRKVSVIDAEITRYFQDDNCEKDVNPLHYWTTKKSLIPIACIRTVLWSSG